MKLIKVSDGGAPDPRVRRFIDPVRIVWQSAGEAAPENARMLLEPGCGQATLRGRVPCTFRYRGEASGIVLDFGRELQGGVQIILRNTTERSPVRLRVRFGESIAEAMGSPDNDHSIHDQVLAAPWMGALEIGNTGFRFVRIDLIDQGAFAEILEVRAIFHFRDDPWVGSFKCSDPVLNQIWETGAYTVHLCMQDYLWDGIKRDRLVWVGDLHPETMVISSVFGGHEIVPRSLDFVRDDTPLPNWMNGISSYSLWWIIVHRDWHLHHGSVSYLAEQREYLVGLLRQLRKMVDEQGREVLTGTRFLDWPSKGNDEAIHAGLQALLKMALVAGADLCRTLGETGEATECAALSARMENYRAPVPRSKQANALLALAGLADPVAINREALARDELNGLSTFYGYYVLQARVLAGDFEGALRVIRCYWGKMLDLGATTFWEDFHLDWAENATGIDEMPVPGRPDIHADFGDHCYKGLRHSLCHGWAAGPTAWMSRHILGFYPIEPGCGLLGVKPWLGNLAFAEGAWPTPYGPVRVRHERGSRGEVTTEIEAPVGVEVVRDAETAEKLKC